MSISCKRLNDSKFFIRCFWYLKILKLGPTAYIQVVLLWLIELYFSWNLSAFILLLIFLLLLILLYISILIWYVFRCIYFVYLLYILLIIELWVLALWYIIIHGLIFLILVVFAVSIIVWMVHVAALGLIYCFVWRLVWLLSLRCVS